MSAELHAANQATFKTTNKSIDILKPSSIHETQQIVKSAFQNRTPLYPLSSGKNWGNGTKVPWQDGCTLLDLSALNQIVDFDESIGLVTIQPGVTQRQLLQFLQEKNSNLMPAMTGSSLDSSLVGNILERGDGFGAHGERSRYANVREVILPSGSIMRLDQSCGPSLGGLFFQSNLGIVTQMTLCLEQKPKFYHQAQFSSDSTNALALEIDCLRTLYQQKLISYASIWNSHKIAARQQALDVHLPAWAGFGALFAFNQEIAIAQIACVRKQMPKVQIIQQEIDLNAFENIQAVDPTREHCGLIWITCALPFKGIDVQRAMELIEHDFLAAGLAPQISLIANDCQRIKLVIAIIYNREDFGMDDIAQNCHDKVLGKLIHAGYPPFRLGLQSYWASQDNALYAQIKDLIDPDHMLSPGHYSPLPKRFSSRSSSSL
ncbi:MAG: FAD-binding oxidoreductase [Myxococcota bacterium]